MSKRNYIYIENHMDTYAEEYRQAKAEYDAFAKENRKMVCNVPKEIIERSIMMQFHEKLIYAGKEKMPTRCMECPMLSMDFLPSGQVGTRCDLNTEIYTGDMFFGAKAKKPEWCPLEKGVHETK